MRSSGLLQSSGGRLAASLLAVATLLGAFVGRPIHIDDPLFLWAARHIQDHPVDFYGFSVNWYGMVTPFTDAQQNPPLLSYWLAVWTALFGWSEVSLHLALLPFALAALAGVWALARELDVPSVESLLVAVATPAFFVSSTTLMCDVPQLCAWTWAVALWVRGIRSGRHGPLAGAAVLAAAAPLLKYVGVGLLPLLLVYGLVARRRVGWWLAWLALPVVVLAGYELLTRRLYGYGLFLGAATFSSQVRSRGALLDPGRLISALAFTGGAFLVVLWLAPRLWNRRAVLVLCGVGATCVAAVAWGGASSAAPLAGAAARWLYLVQLGVLAAVGAGVLWLLVEEAWRERSAGGILLTLWAAGILAFAFVVNWALNVRSLLTMVPVVAVIAARRAARRDGRRGSVARGWPIAAGAVVAVLVALADYRLAETARDAAGRIGAELRGAGRTATFLGHWGFQWYAEQQGLVAVDPERQVMKSGDLVVVSATSANTYELPPGAAVVRSVIVERPLPFLATMSPAVGAGFHADEFGRLPFAFGRVPPETYEIRELVARLRPAER